MYTAKRKGFIALLAALLLAALIAFGISMLPAASRTASAETKSVSTAQALLTAFTEANEGDTIQLEGNIVIDMTDPGTVQQTGGHMVIASEAALKSLYPSLDENEIGKNAVANNITLDLNQKTLTLKTTSTVGCIAVYGVNLTVKNGTITGESEAGLAVVGNAGGDNGALTVEDTTINFTNLNTQAQSAAPVISGEGELTLSNVTYELSAAEGAQEPVAPYVAEIGGKGYSSLQDAFDNATSGQKVVLSANITVDKYITVNYDDERKIGSGKEDNLNITFDLNGHVITLAESFTTQFSMDGRSSNKLAGGAFLRIYGADFTITDSNAAAKSSAWENVGGGIDGRAITTIDGTAVDDNDGNEVTLIVAQDGAKVTISAGTYVIKDNTAACVYAFGESTVNLVGGGTEDIAASYITIEGGEFINLSNAEYGYGTGSALVVNQANVGDRLVTITGGTFYGRNPALGDDSKAAGTFITSGVKLYEDSNGNYIATEGDVPEDAVNTFYFEDGQVVSELNSAVAIETAIADGADYIRLGGDITGSIEIPSGKTVTLDLNGKTLTNTEGEHTITNYGTLTVTGTGTVDNISHGRGALINYGTATLSGGKFTRSQENGTFGDGVSASEGGTYSANGNSWYTLKNYGALTINNDVTVTTRIDAEVNGNPVGGYSSLIANGYQNSDDRTNNYDKVTTDNKIPQLTIAGGTFSGGINTIKNDEYSGLEISGGTFTNTTQHTVLNYGKAEVSGGEFVVSGSDKAVIWTEYYNTITPGTLTVSGGEFTSDTYALVAMNGADVNITGGTFSAKYAVVANGNTTAVDIEDGDFDGAIFSQSPEFTNISGGTFSEKPADNYLTESAAAYSVGDKFVVGNAEDEGTLEDIVAAGAVAKIENGGTVDFYISLADAVKAAADGATITLIADTLEQKQVNITKNLTIDLNGFDIVRDGTSGSAIGIKGGYTLTLKGEGMIAAAGSSLPITRYLFGNTPYHVASDAGIIYSRPITEDWFAQDSYTLSYDSATGGFKVVEGATVATIAVGANVYAFDSLKSAFYGAQDGETIVLMQDITIDDNSRVAYGESAILDKAVTLDLNGYTINSECSTNPVISIVTSNDFTITSTCGTGKIVLGGGRALRIEAATNADIAVSISNIAITGNTNTHETILFDGSAGGASIKAFIDGISMNINVAQGGSTVFAVRAENTDLVVRNSSIEIGRGSGFNADTVALEAYGSNITVENSVLNSKNGAGIVFCGIYSSEDAADLATARYNVLTVRQSAVAGYTLGISGNAGEGNHGTIINVEDSTIIATIGAGIFQPQVGELNIKGSGNTIKGTSAIEFRSGTLNIEGGVFTATAEEFFESTEPSGQGVDGAAIAISQHSYTGNADPAIDVNISGGTFMGIYALYEKDRVANGATAITINVTGGTFNGDIYSENVTAFVNGGEFAQALDGEYIAPGYAFDEATGTVVSATLNNNALADVRAYLAAYGLLYGDIEDLAIAGTPDALAQAIVNAYEAIATATGEEAIAVAKMDALDAIDAFIDNLNTVKAEAIAELEELIMEPVDITEDGEVIKEAVVAMPTYIVSAINGAKSAAEVEKYVAVATAEINELIDMREQAADDQLALENQLNSIISALGIVQQAGGSWSSSFLAGIEESVNTAKDNIFTISSLLGRPTDEATAETIFGKLEEANANIQGVYDKLSAEISAMLTGEGGISSQLEELKGLVDENSALAADIDNVLATAGRIEGALGNINSNNTLSNVLEQMNNLVSDYQSTVTNAILNISTRLDQLQQNMPTDSTIANALRSVIAGVENDIDILKAEVDALDEPNGALVTAINEKIEAAFESFGNTFTSELDKLNGTIAGLDTAIDNLPETLDIEGIKQAIADAKSAAEAAGTKVDALTSEEGVLTTIDGKIDAIDGVVDGIADAQESMGNALTTFATATDTALKGIQSDIDGLESKLNAMANTAATDKADILAKIAELKSAADDISEAIASLDGDSAEDLSGIAEDLAALQTALDGVKADIGNVSQQVGGVAEDNTNSMSNFAGLYLFLSALVVLAIAILIVVSVKKRR